MNKNWAFYAIVIFAFFSSLKALTFSHPLSWDVWYHVRVVEMFLKKEFFWDSQSFYPGRPHLYPPLYHLILALFYHVVNSLKEISLERFLIFLTPIAFSFTILTFFIFTKEIFNKKTAIFSSLILVNSPIFLDKGLTFLPENLSMIFTFFGFLFFFKEKYLISSVFGAFLILTHGVSAVTYFAVLFGFFIFERKFETLKNFLKVFVLSLVFSSPYLIYVLRYGFHEIPYGGKHALIYYPYKLGFIPLLLVFFSLRYIKLEKKYLFLISYLFMTFLLSRNPLFLPYRFLEFMAFPIAIFGGIFLKNLKLKRNQWIALIFLTFFLSYHQAHHFTEKYKPYVSEKEYTAFLWLKENSVNGVVLSKGVYSPIIAYVSKRPVVLGAFAPAGIDVEKRILDTEDFFKNCNFEISKKYDVEYVYEMECGKMDKIHSSNLYFITPKT